MDDLMSWTYPKMPAYAIKVVMGNAHGASAYTEITNRVQLFRFPTVEPIGF